MNRLIPLVLLAAFPAHAAPVAVRATLDHAAVAEGRSVMLSAEARRGGKPAAGLMLRPYVNGKRWGAEGRTNARGRVQWPLPLPNPGTARIEVAVAPPAWKPDASWIWAPGAKDGETVYLQKRFRLPAAPSAAKLYITADDSFQAWANGQPAVLCYIWEDDRDAFVLHAIDVLSFRGERIAAVDAFLDPSVYPAFDAPLELAR